jgi:hypothetical protein
MSDFKPFLAKLLQASYDAPMSCLISLLLEANRNEMAGNFSFPIATK